LRPFLATATFHDAYRADLRDVTLSPTEIYLHASRATPRWVHALMSIRNELVRRVGLKSVGALNMAADKLPAAFDVGDQIGIFGILSKTEDELLLGIDDRHLDLRVSIRKGTSSDPNSYVVATAVKVHNWLGRAYMLPVGRIHPLVVKALMRRTLV